MKISRIVEMKHSDIWLQRRRSQNLPNSDAPAPLSFIFLIKNRDLRGVFWRLSVFTITIVDIYSANDTKLESGKVRFIFGCC